MKTISITLAVVMLAAFMHVAPASAGPKLFGGWSGITGIANGDLGSGR